MAELVSALVIENSAQSVLPIHLPLRGSERVVTSHAW